MTTPARILRALIQDIPGAELDLSLRAQNRFDMIVNAGRAAFAEYGRAGVTLQNLAAALFLPVATLRRFICDIDYLLAIILMRHLQAIEDALAQLPADLPDRAAACRAAYLAATRSSHFTLTENHRIFVKEHLQLPADLITIVAERRARIGGQIAGPHGQVALGLLDMPELSGGMIEAMLTTLVPGQPEAQRVHGQPAIGQSPTRAFPAMPRLAELGQAPFWPLPGLEGCTVAAMVRARAGP